MVKLEFLTEFDQRNEEILVTVIRQEMVFKKWEFTMDQATGFTIHVLDLSFIFYFVVGQNEAKNEILPKLMIWQEL